MSTLREVQSSPKLAANGIPRIGPRKHVLDLDDFSIDEILTVLESAKGMSEVLRRDIKKVPALRGRVIVTLFYEASTRTRISFEEAGKVLSADVINMSSSGSSTEKGESLLNTGLTIQAMGVDIIVIRHPPFRRTLLPGAKPGPGRDYQRRRRNPCPPDSGPAGPLHRKGEIGRSGRSQDSHHRRRTPQPCRPLGYLGVCQNGSPGWSSAVRRRCSLWTCSRTRGN